MLKRITHSPQLNILSGLVLLFTAGYETWESIDHFQLGAHHGVLLFSIIHILKSLPEFIEAAGKIQEARSTA